MLRDHREFFRQFRTQFQTTGAIAPSSRRLARAMTRYVASERRPARILEVGPGTGAVTRQIVTLLKADDRLDMVELNEAFAGRLEQRFQSEPSFQAGRRPVADPRLRDRIIPVRSPVRLHRLRSAVQQFFARLRGPRARRIFQLSGARRRAVVFRIHVCAAGARSRLPRGRANPHQRPRPDSERPPEAARLPPRLGVSQPAAGLGATPSQKDRLQTACARLACSGPLNWHCSLVRRRR